MITKLNLPDPRLTASVSYETWDPWTSSSSALHPGWYDDDPGLYTTAAFANILFGPGAAMRVAVVFRCVNLIANMVASLPCNLFRQRGREKERLRDHRAALAVRRRPNSWQTRFDFFRDMQANCSLWGRCHAEVTNDGRRVELIPREPKFIEVKQQPGRELIFLYRNPETGRQETILADEMLYRRDLATDFHQGLVRAQLAREAIMVAQSAEQYVRRYFENDAGSRIFFKHPGNFNTPEKRAEFESYLRRSVQGWRNHHRPILGYGGLDAEELGKAQEGDFIVGPREFQAAEIAQFWGVPGFLIGLEKKSTTWGSGLSEQMQGFRDITIKPEVLAWQEALARALLSEDEQEDHFFEFEFGALLQANPVEQANAFKTYKDIGVFSPNDIRAKINENPREGGDTYQDTSPGAPPNAGNDAGANDGNNADPDVRAMADTYGLVVRAGAVTPQMDDEDHMRALAGLPPMSAAAREAWSRERVRRPITLAVPPTNGQTRDTGGQDDGHTSEARTVPTPLLADAADRITKATGRGGREKWYAFTVQTLQPVALAFALSDTRVTDAAQRISEAMCGQDVAERWLTITHILTDIFQAGNHATASAD